MQCRVINKLTPSEVCITTPEEEDMEVVEDTKVVEDTEANEGVEEHFLVVEGRSSIIIVVSKVTSHKTVQQLPTPIVKPSVTLLKSAQCY